MGGKVEPAGAPVLDRTPVEVRQPAPRVAHVPGVGGTDVIRDQECCGGEAQPCGGGGGMGCEAGGTVVESEQKIDRKSTRLNSSHGHNSYCAFFFEKKKKKNNKT